jgi:hypothetical protein
VSYFGGLLLGLAQHLGVWYISSKWQDAIAFVILILFLLFRPQGFFGRSKWQVASRKQLSVISEQKKSVAIVVGESYIFASKEEGELMADLTKFAPTRKTEFEQLARDRKDDFEALREKGRWTASVYIGPYVVEARLKFKICDALKLEQLPAILKTHDLLALVIFAGLLDALNALPKVSKNFKKILRLHENTVWRYKIADSSHKATSDRLNKWLFNPNDGVMTWLGL